MCLLYLDVWKMVVYLSFALVQILYNVSLGWEKRVNIESQFTYMCELYMLSSSLLVMIVIIIIMTLVTVVNIDRILVKDLASRIENVPCELFNGLISR